MSTKVNGLAVQFSVLNPQIRDANNFEAEVVFTNDSGKRLRLNALFLDIPKVLLRVRRSDGTPVNPGPPPMPPVDDGKEGRIDLEPGKSVTFAYKGSQYFGAPLMPDTYEVRFRYENTLPQHGEWTGTIETGWVSFEVIRTQK